jgi:hypothetical protein
MVEPHFSKKLKVVVEISRHVAHLGRFVYRTTALLLYDDYYRTTLLAW